MKKPALAGFFVPAENTQYCGRDMSRPYDCPTPYHPVILAPARIRTYSDASLDSCLRRNDGLLVHCWLVQVRARLRPRHVVTLRLPDTLPPRHPRAGEDPCGLAVSLDFRLRGKDVYRDC